jgi:LasA protease
MLKRAMWRCWVLGWLAACLALSGSTMDGSATTTYRGGGSISPSAQGGYITYTVKAGDTLSGIAARYGVSMSSLISLNGLRNADAIRIGQTLRIPAGGNPPAPAPAVVPGREGPATALIPDSEAVYSPSYIGFDVADFARRYGGYLATYSEKVEGETMTGPQIVQIIAERFSVGPRVLLTVLEMHGGWVTGSPVTARQRDVPLDINDTKHKGLYYQMWYAANFMNAGYYGKLNGRLTAMQLEDGGYARFAAAVNPGTAAVQNMLARTTTYSDWLAQLDTFSATYKRFFGDPFAKAIEPLVPSNLKQPLLRMPFEDGHIWYFTGGAHGAWADGSAWGAVDFAPSGGPGGCAVSSEWSIAAGAGRIAQAEHGRVMLNLDGNDFQGDGWTLMYMHTSSKARVAVGTYVFMGDHIGHPSCEGGYSQATHLHIARMYNGQWLPVAGGVPFNLGGWQFKGGSSEYDGSMTRADVTRPAINGHVDRLNALRGELGPDIMALINQSP